jgi:hypothetical protein
MPLTSLFSQFYSPAQQDSVSVDVHTLVSSGQGNQVNHCGNQWASNGNRMEYTVGLKNPAY